VVTFLKAEGVSQSEIHRKFVFTARMFFSQKGSVHVVQQFKDSRTAQNDDPERLRGRPGIPHTDENRGTVKGLIREDQRVKVHVDFIEDFWGCLCNLNLDDLCACINLMDSKDI
jgi:hypothetical protein